MSGLQAKLPALSLQRDIRSSVTPIRRATGSSANVLKADKMDLRESQGWLSRGYEGAVTGAALGAGITAYNSSSAGATLGVGLAAGLVGMAADAMVEDVNYTMITDVQIAERTKTQVQTDNVAVLRQGTSGAKVQTSTETGNQHKYQTRVVSNANKVNLKFLKPSLFLKTSWQNRSLISCKRSIPRPGYSGPDWHHLSGVSEFIRQIIS
ncbi:conjugal transfer surface exclusion protein TraT (plasmid) [Klebsiella quasipneumoniae]|uniref:complement resistance protein TraT n=1 Tax=Klebsiella quasipneumoniae TaxID=1463165 RepID=UPI00226EDE56|nr:complement resistance protein TraT [Klebsiella quasipneumoniae]CAH1460232.1 conjugal transfer surface exclusion protein TraT [Klebsiella quasipneumoniae]